MTTPAPPSPVGVLAADDPWVAERLATLAGVPPVRWLDWAAATAGDDAVTVVVVELVDDDAVAVVEAARARWPEALVAGYLALPDQDRWIRAQRAGADLVVNRGALTSRLRAALAGAAQRARTFPLVTEADVAGRLGLVGRVADTPRGPVAVYQLAGQLTAVADACPHAGATLSEGELDRGVVTCPRHGSQFDVRSGERLRGPADTDLATFRLRRTGGQVVMVLDDQEEDGP